MKREHEKLDAIFDALANRHRRGIVYRLSLQPSTISLLADELDLSLPAIHKHIKILEDAGLVQRKKVGRNNFLALRRNSLHQLRKWLNQYNNHWGSDEETLENYVKNLEQREKSRKS